jgi:uncharacterized membrane protein YfcA
MWVIAALTAAAAGFVRGFTGFGGPAVMTLVLVQLYSPASVLATVVLADAASNVKLLPSTVREVDWRVTGIISVASLLGMPLGVHLLLVADPVLVRRAIALVVAASTVVMLLGWRLRRVPPLWAYALVAFVSGVILGATYIALVMIVFLFACPVPATTSRANTVYWAFILTVWLIGAYAFTGILDADGAWRALLLGMVYLAGTALGTAIFRTVSERDFRRVALWLLLFLAGVGLVGR